MKAINISATETNTIVKLPHNYVLISINDEDKDLFPLLLDRNDERILTLRFTDIPCDINKNGFDYHAITDKQAKIMVDFIDKFKDYHFLIHCFAGVSRSGAVALYLHIVYGKELKENFWFTSHPNAYVLGLLIREKFTTN